MTDSAEFLGKKVDVFDAYKDRTVAQLTALRNDGTPLQVTSLSGAIDGQDAWQVQYDVGENDTKLPATQWLTVHDGRGWVFTWVQSASDAADPQAANLASRIMASIHFLPTPAGS